MSWRADGILDLPDQDLDELEFNADEGDTSEHKEFVLEVINEMFTTEHLRPGTYNVRVSGHTNKNEDDKADNLNININRTVR